MSALTLGTSLAAIAMLMLATENRIWRGLLSGFILAVCIIFHRNEFGYLQSWSDLLNDKNSWTRLVIGFFYYWIVFVLSVLPLAGGCVDPILNSYVRLGCYTLAAVLICHFAIVCTFTWIVFNGAQG